MAELITYDGLTGERTVSNFTPESSEHLNTDYTIGKSTPWRRMTNTEAIAVKGAMDQQSIRDQEIYRAAAYIDTRDELYGTMLAVLTALFGQTRAKELLAPEEIS